MDNQFFQVFRLTNKDIAVLIYARILKYLPGDINEDKIISKITNSDIVKKTNGNLNYINEIIRKCISNKQNLTNFFDINVKLDRHTSFKVSKKFLNTIN